MARYLRQSTTATVKLGPFLSPSDGVTAFASGGFVVKVAASGGALAARHDATAIAYDADGYYSVELDATDTATVGRLKVEVPGSAGNYLPVWDDCVVLSGPVFDWLFGSTGIIPANVTQIAGSAQAATNLAADEGAAVPAGFGAWTLPQTIRAVAAVLFGKRTGVPAAGSGGTVTITDGASTPVSYGTITYDASGNVTALNLTPPA